LQLDTNELLSAWITQAERTIALAQRPSLRVIGIHRGGVWLAEHLHAALGLDGAIGQLDIGFHRDDYGTHGMQSETRPSQIPFDVEGANIVLVDDVLHTGRTIRAALNEIFDYGRPARVWLAVLLTRPGRQLPIQADIVGMHLERDVAVKLRGPEPLHVEVLP